MWQGKFKETYVSKNFIFTFLAIPIRDAMLFSFSCIGLSRKPIIEYFDWKYFKNIAAQHINAQIGTKI